MIFCRPLILFPKLLNSKNSSRSIIRVSNSLDLEPARHSVGPDLDDIKTVCKGYRQTTLADEEF